MPTLTPHPLAELFPPMDEQTFKGLVADIRQNGLREAIFLWEGMILDGRNRYRACQELGISPITRHWDGPGDPLDFVVSKNLHRRHLDESQRAAVAAKISNMRAGHNQHTTEVRSIDRTSNATPVSNVQAAKMLNVSEKSVRRAKVVLDKGAPELQAAVETGAVSVGAAAAVAYNLDKDEQRELVRQGPTAIVQAAKEFRSERPSAPKLSIVPPVVETPKVSSSSRISVPEGSTVEAQVRKGMTLEDNGSTIEKAAKEVGIGLLTYRSVRDLIVMLEQIDLTPSDRQAVSIALSTINETKQITSYDTVEPMVRRVWGSPNSKNHHTLKTARKRVDHFATVVGIAVQSCSNFELEEFEIPYLSDDETKRWVKELEGARRSLDAFLKKLKGV